MKKIALLLSVIASACILASCATHTQPAPAADTSTSVSHHHDYKGER